MLPLLALPVSRGATAEGPIEELLPASGEIGDWRWAYDPDIYVGEHLFDLINGGAEIYYEYGFSRALACTFENPGGASINLEIYEMNDAASAYGIYSFKTGDSGRPLALGGGGVLEEYYLNFWKGTYLVTLVGFASDRTTIDGLLALGSAIDQKIQKGGAPPVLISHLEKEQLRRVKYLKGNFALYNNYVFDTRNIFDLTEGVLGYYPSFRLFLFRYADAADAKKSFANAGRNMKRNGFFDNFTESENEFRAEDREGRFLRALPCENFILISVCENEGAADTALAKTKEAIVK